MAVNAVSGFYQKSVERDVHYMTRHEVLFDIEEGKVLRKDFHANPGAGIWEHQFSVEILFTGHEYYARFLPYGRDTGYLINVTKDQVVSFVNRNYDV